MSMHLYDEALVEYLRAVSNDGRIHVIPPDNVMSFLAQINEDKVIFPAISVSRGSVSLTETRNQVAAMQGQTVRLNSDNTATKIKLLPMRMEWRIDVFAVDRFSCDEIIRELIFYIYTHPRLKVTVPYSVDIPQNFDIFINPEIEDNSDLLEFVNRGDLFRETISVYTENAHLFSSGHLYLTKVKSDVVDDIYHNKI